MAEIERILQLVADGALTAEEADEIIAALNARTSAGSAAEPRPQPERGPGRQLRIEVSEGGRQVVNLRVPMNIAGWASAFLPGLSDDDAERIRAAVSSGMRGPILDVGSDGSRVLIVSE